MLATTAWWLGCLAAFGHAAAVVPQPVARSEPSYVRLPNCSPTPLALQNAGFQSGHLAPWVLVPTQQGKYPLPTNFTVETLPGTLSDDVLRIDAYVTTYRYDQPYLNQSGLTLCNGYQYQIDFDYQVVRAYPTAYILVGGSTLDEQERGLAFTNVPASATTGWQHHTSFNNITSLTYLDFIVGLLSTQLPPQNGSGASVRMDNFSMVPVQSLSAPGCPYEPPPLGNSHFQTGQLTPWKLKVSSGTATAAVVAGSHGDNQSYALRFSFQGPTYASGLQFAHPVQTVCLDYVYVFELVYNVITPAPPLSGNANDSWVLEMRGCEGVNAQLEYISDPSGPGNFSIVGPKQVKAMCQMNHNGAASATFVFSSPSFGNAVVDVLSIKARLATSDDLAGG